MKNSAQCRALHGVLWLLIACCSWMMSTAAPAGDAGIQESLISSCKSCSNVVIGTVRSVQEIMNYDDDRKHARVLHGAVLDIDAHLWGEASSRILVLMCLDRDQKGWGPIFRVPEQDQRFLFFLWPLGVPGSTNLQWRLPCFVPVGRYYVGAICERSAADFSGYSWVLEDLLRNELVAEQLASETNAPPTVPGERRLARAVAAMIEKGLDPGTLTNLTEAVRQIKQEQAKPSSQSAPTAMRSYPPGDEERVLGSGEAGARRPAK